METWQELTRIVEAGEREFGPLDAHQTVRHNLVRRCEEIIAEAWEPGTGEVLSPDRPTAAGMIE